MSYKGKASPIEPATGAKKKAPLELFGRVLWMGWPQDYVSGAISEAPVGIIKASTGYLHDTVEPVRVT